MENCPAPNALIGHNVTLQNDTFSLVCSVLNPNPRPKLDRMNDRGCSNC